MSENGQIPLLLIHGPWLSARSWENYADYFGGRGFAVSAPDFAAICDLFVSMRI